jgi:hypothetical protein
LGIDERSNEKCMRARELDRYSSCEKKRGEKENALLRLLAFEEAYRF